MSEPTFLLAIALGPVQDFIAASRKARDLWAGSDLLSDLASIAAKSLRGPETLIFPTEKSLDQDHAVANKLLVVSTDPEADAAHARTQVQAELDRRWRALKLPGDAIDASLANAQVATFLEWYAAWVPYDPNDTDGPACYERARNRVERVLAGRKALRTFGPATGIDMRPKSALDPSRESVVLPARRRDPDVRARLRLKGAEELDAISLLKRLGAQKRFVSTSRVAVDPLLRAMARHDPVRLKALEEEAEKLSATDLAEPFPAKDAAGLAHYHAFPFDSQLFYATSTDHARALIDQDPVSAPDGAWKDAAASFLGTLGEFAGDHPEWRDPPAYLAVLRADGDRMGAALSRLTSVEHHRTLSTGLGRFAIRAGEIVRTHHGAFIYSGGDDVLAFLPLDTALPCADALQTEFARIVRDALPDGFPGMTPTLSVGIAIGHYAEHLQSLLDRAADAERAAKVIRNALAVAFSAHSGGGQERLAVRSWRRHPVRDAWGAAITLHLHDLFPDGGAYELETLRQEFIRAHEEHVFASDDAADDLLGLEVTRILRRKRPKRGQETLQKGLVDQVRDRLTERPEPSDDGIPPPPSRHTHALDALGAFVNETIVARRIARLFHDPEGEAVTLWKNSGTELYPAPKSVANDKTEAQR